MPRILAISFSDFSSDARVLRQLDVLKDFGDVTTIGYGPLPHGASDHLEIPRDRASLPQTIPGAAKLGLRRHSWAELTAPAEVAALDLIGSRSFDLVVANEARALPLAHAVRGKAPVWGDMHEWAPEERTHVLSWRLLVAPYMRHVCEKYLPLTDAVTTVNSSIARLYDQQFGTSAEVVRNARGFEDLSPSRMEPDRIRLVHSGAAVPGRDIESLITATLSLDHRFSLDLYLIQGRDGGAYWKSLRAMAADSERIRFHDAVLPAELPRVLNQYDVGIFNLPPRTTNHRLMLPNKLFDFVQARLAVVFSPSVETDAVISAYSLGAVTPGFTADDMAVTLKQLTREEIASFKQNANEAASALSAETDVTTERAIVSKLLRL
ncbi:hypothetical protein [Microbacterium sp. MPKO10]|uniref:hypothetical protein n=1 Tax=Microbacterium sp. MPKO10 TaxID=2989818 RepID=UPI002235A774|nr:hypothetical protein [Microbacterium sp. MPKO10]MCW4457815.1 hypothetical protein [Microbacterium sp. MPKO10]